MASRMDFSTDEFKAECVRIAGEEHISQEQLQSEFLPDTYEVYWTATPAELIAKIRSNYRRFWTDERARQAGVLGLTPLQVSVLASEDCPAVPQPA